MVALSLVLSLTVGVLGALLPRHLARRLFGHRWLGIVVVAGAATLILPHIWEHLVELHADTVARFGTPAFVVIAGLLITLLWLGRRLEQYYHVHEDDRAHAQHEQAHAHSAGFARLFFLTVHAVLDGHAIREVVGTVAWPIIVHKGVDGLVINEERHSNRQRRAWLGRIAIQQLGTTLGVFYPPTVFMPDYAASLVLSASGMLLLGIYSGYFQELRQPALPELPVHRA
jgi:hypothetical protein